MSVSFSSGVGLSPLYASGGQQPQRQDFRDLARALKTGDLSGAQQAFSQLTQDLSNQSSSSSIAGQLGDSNSVLGQDLAAVGKALDNGDVSGAQQSFQKLREDIKSQVQGQGGGVQGHHHHHHRAAGNDGDADDGNGQGSATPTNAATTQTSGSLLNVVG